MSVALARALAEAVDGYPGRRYVYAIAAYALVNNPTGFDIRVPLGRWEDLTTEERDLVLSGKYGFFGPFDTTASIVAEGERVKCVSIRLQGDELIDYPGTHVDALFFSAPAVEKFAVPYYERIFGPEFAQDVMAHFRYNSVQVMAHFPWSEYTDPPKPLPPGTNHPPRPSSLPGGPAFLARTARGPRMVPVLGTREHDYRCEPSPRDPGAGQGRV